MNKFTLSVVASAAVLLAACGKKEEAPKAVAAAPAASAAPAAPPPSELVIKIGHVGPTSGAIAHLGKDNENGARMAIDDLNAKGVMIGGKKAKFELLAEDDAADPKQGTAVGAEAGRRQGQRRHRPPELGHHDPGLEDLQRRRHSADLAVGDQPEVHPPGLQDHLPRGGRRRAPGRHARQVRRQRAEGQDHRRHRRPHGLRPGRGRRVREGRQGRRRQDRRPRVHQRQGDRLHRHPDPASRPRSPTWSSSAAWTRWPARCCAR